MKPQFKHGFCLLFFLLLSAMAIKAEVTVLNSENESEVSYALVQDQVNNLDTESQKQTDSDSGSLFVNQIISLNILSFDSKLVYKSLLLFNDYKDKIKPFSLLSKYHYSYLHPDLIGYYIYELRKIII